MSENQTTMTSAEQALKNILLWRHAVLSHAQQIVGGLDGDPDGIAIALFDGPLWDAASVAMEGKIDWSKVR